jgi:hypothetical protein
MLGKQSTTLTEIFLVLICNILSKLSMTREIMDFHSKSSIQKEEDFFFFTSKFDLNLSKKLVKCYIWITTLYGVEIWTLRKVDQKKPENFLNCNDGEK